MSKNAQALTPLDEVKVQVTEFHQQAEHFWNRSTKPSDKEFVALLKSTGIAMAGLGAVGFATKLVCVPLVAFLIG